MLRKASADGKLPTEALLKLQKEKDAQSISVSTVDGWRLGETVDFILFKVDSDQEIIPGSVSSWTGIPASNGDINNLVLKGGMDQLYPPNSVVMATTTSAWANDLVGAILVSHNSDGTLKDGSVTYEALDSTTEFVEQGSSIDFNDARLLKFGKWTFRENDVIKACANRPSDNPGWLISTPLNPAVIPGSQAKGYVKQQYADIEGNFYTRIIKSGDTAAPVTYGEWMKEAKDYPDVKTAKEEDVQIGWGMILKLTRIGNTVSARIDQINEIPAGVFSPSEKIPKKYRPINNTNMLITGINSGRYAGNTMYRFAKDGSITGHSAIPGRQEWYGSVTWLTDQPWEK